jgi:hypothetical protein
MPQYGRIASHDNSQPLKIRHSVISFPNHVPVTRQYAMILTLTTLGDRSNAMKRLDEVQAVRALSQSVI